MVCVHCRASVRVQLVAANGGAMSDARQGASTFITALTGVATPTTDVTIKRGLVVDEVLVEFVGSTGRTDL